MSTSDRVLSDLDTLTDLLQEGRISRREFMAGGLAVGIGLASLAPIAEAVASPEPAPLLAKKGGTVTTGVANAVGKFDPHGWSGFTSNIVTNHVYQGLVRLNFKTSQIEPCLAQSWSHPNPLTYIYHLRKGVHFHDGTEVTAQDVVFSVQRAKKVSWGAYGLANLASIRALDKYTVQVKLSKPDWRFKWFFYWPPGAVLSKKYFEKVGEAKATEIPIGTGPFRVASSSQSQVVLAKFSGYWEKGLPDLDKVILKVLDPSTILAGFRTGEIQLSPDVGFDQLKLANSLGNTGIQARVGPHIVLTALNVTEKPFNDVWVRRAMAEALDNEAALSAYPTKYYMPSNGAMIHPVFRYSAYKETNKVYTRNLTKAKAYLQKSSVPTGFTASWITAATRPQEVSAVLGAQERLKKIGIHINIQQLPDPDVAGKLYTRPRPFQIITYNWLHNQPIAIDPLAGLMSSGVLAGSNWAGYSNHSFDTILAEAISATKSSVIGAKMRQLQLIQVHDVPYLVHGWDAVRRVEVNKLVTPPQTVVAEWDDWFRSSYLK
jgi:peptide/nickel transport system substrate-binding protein